MWDYTGTTVTGHGLALALLSLMCREHMGREEKRASTHTMASRFSFYSFPGYEFLISTITFFDIKNLIVDNNY